MPKPPADVARAARSLARKVEELRRVNPELAMQIEEWTTRLLEGEPLPSVQAEMHALLLARGISPKTTVH